MFKIIVIAIFTSGLITPFFVVKSQSLNISKDIFISEINYSGSQLESNCQKTTEIERVGCGLDKWLEIANNSAKEINLQNYKIRLSYKDIIISDSWIISPKSVGILANKNKHLASSLDNLGLNIYKIGFLQSISSKEKASLSVGLVSPENLLLDSIIRPAEFSNKTLERVNEVEWKLSELEYLPNNYGTPGKLSFAIIQDSLQKTDVLKPILSPNNEASFKIQNLNLEKPSLAEISTSQILPTVTKTSEKIASISEIKQSTKQNSLVVEEPKIQVSTKKVIPKIEITTQKILDPKIIQEPRVEVVTQAELISLKIPDIIKIQQNKIAQIPIITNFQNSPSLTTTFLDSNYEQILILGFLTLFSILQRIIVEITKKCKSIFAYKFKTK